MSTLNSLLDLLNKWPAWKRITSAPDEIDALRKRIELLEASMHSRAPSRDECPSCHALGWRLIGNRKDADFGDMGVSYDQWRCSSCGFSREVEHR